MGAGRDRGRFALRFTPGVTLRLGVSGACLTQTESRKARMPRPGKIGRSGLDNRYR